MITTLLCLPLPKSLIREILLFADPKFAIKYDNPKTLRYAINTNFIKIDPNEGLVLAAEHNHLGNAKIWISAGASVNFYFCRALRVAAERDNFEVFEFLHKSGADLSSLNDIVFISAILGSSRIFEYLLQLQPKKILSVMFSINKYNLIDRVLEKLPHKKINIILKSIQQDVPVFGQIIENYQINLLYIWACKCRSVNAIISLIESGANVNAYGDAILNYAIDHSHLALVTALMQNGFKPRNIILKFNTEYAANRASQAMRIILSHQDSLQAIADPIARSILNNSDKFLHYADIGKYGKFIVEFAAFDLFKKFINNCENPLDYIVLTAEIKNYEKFAYIMSVTNHEFAHHECLYLNIADYYYLYKYRH